jgi:hypothetical protein
MHLGSARGTIAPLGRHHSNSPTPRLRSGCTLRLRSGYTTRLRSGYTTRLRSDYKMEEIFLGRARKPGRGWKF